MKRYFIILLLLCSCEQKNFEHNIEYYCVCEVKTNEELLYQIQLKTDNDCQEVQEDEFSQELLDEIYQSNGEIFVECH